LGEYFLFFGNGGPGGAGGIVLVVADVDDGALMVVDTSRGEGHRQETVGQLSRSSVIGTLGVNPGADGADVRAESSDSDLLTTSFMLHSKVESRTTLPPRSTLSRLDMYGKD
jgi:hypothetical protein